MKIFAAIIAFFTSLLSPSSAPSSQLVPTSTPEIVISISPIPSTPSATPIKPTLKPISTIKPTGRAPLAPIPCEGRDGGDCANITPRPTATTNQLYDTRYKNVTITIKMKTAPFCSQNTPKTVEIRAVTPESKVFNNDTTSSTYKTTSGDSVVFSGLYSGSYYFTIKYCTDKEMLVSVADDENMLPGKSIIKNVELIENPIPHVYYD